MTPSTPAGPVGRPSDARRFGGLTYDAFRRMAEDAALSDNERVGFPDAYRDGFDEVILADIRTKLPALDGREAVVVEIGPGCSELSRMVRALCEERGHRLILVDSPEMLAHHEPGPAVELVPGRFPAECASLVSGRRGRVDAVLAYSVIQYAFADASPFEFVDAACELLAPGGRLLIGDVPNQTMRDRFLASEAGAAHHREYTGSEEPPEVPFARGARGEPDDAAILALAARARAAGFHGWVVPQDRSLPMANRREDLLIERP